MLAGDQGKCECRTVRAYGTQKDRYAMTRYAKAVGEIYLTYTRIILILKDLTTILRIMQVVRCLTTFLQLCVVDIRQ